MNKNNLIQEKFIQFVNESYGYEIYIQKRYFN